MPITTKDHILHALNGSEAQRIRFTFPAGGGTMTISRTTFARVARAIAHDHIKVRVTNALPPGVGAEYHTDTNTILTPPVIGRPDEGLVLHECTHASFDLSRTVISALDDEAAAYVVDALYFRMSGLARPRWNNTLHMLAGTVADSLLNMYQAGTVAIPAVNPVLWHGLRLNIIVDPVYVTGPAGTGGSYLHNG